MGEKLKITARYKDQPQTCYECGQPGHEKTGLPRTANLRKKKGVTKSTPTRTGAGERARVGPQLYSEVVVMTRITNGLRVRLMDKPSKLMTTTNWNRSNETAQPFFPPV